jgi:hypothetical protein
MPTSTKTTIWDIALTVIKSKWFWIATAAIIIVWYFYSEGKKAAEGTQAELPNNGTGIPAGWTPGADAMGLHDEMDNGSWLMGAGYGTDEEKIWSILTGKTDDQLISIYNEFNRLYQADSGMTLIGWFNEDLSGDDLTRALDYFNGLPGVI